MTNRNRFSPHEGMKKMYEDAQRDMDAAAAERAEDAETTRRQEVFNDRLPAANDRAEYELFGSRGRTYTDPETGEVIADARNPQPGLIESMRTNQRYGKTEAERNAYADAYESRLETLTSDDGLELAQAKLLLDLEQADIQKRGKMIGEQITNGKSAVDAEKHVDALIGRLAEKRRGMIEAGGALSIEDYEQLRKGVDLYAETPEASPVDPVETEAPVQKKEHKGIYSGRSVEELEEVIRNADKHGDNSTASEAQRELDIIKLRQRTEEAWGKKPEATPSATAAETTKRNSAPSEADKTAAAEAARQASEASPETPSESDKAAAAEAASRASGDSEASTGEAEPNASEKEKSKKERRMGKIRRGFNRALTWLMAETKDDEGSSESKSKTSGGSAGAVGGMRKGFNSFRDQWKEQRASKIDTAAAAESDTAKPSESGKTAAAAVEGSKSSDAKVERNVERINSHKETLVFSDTEIGGGSSALLFDKTSSDRIDFSAQPGDGAHKYINQPTAGGPDLYILEMDNGAKLAIGDGVLVDLNRGDVRSLPDDGLPELVFGEPWKVSDDITVPSVKSLMAEYKVGGVEGEYVDQESPFTQARRMVNRASNRLRGTE